MKPSCKLWKIRLKAENAECTGPFYLRRWAETAIHVRVNCSRQNEQFR